VDSLIAIGSAVGSLLKERKETLAVAESSAGGLINAALVAVPGAANIRSASEPFAKLLARRVRDNLGATWGLSETGASGPTGNRYGDAAGHACIAVSGPVDAVITVETGSANREANMWVFARQAIALLEACLRKA